MEKDVTASRSGESLTQAPPARRVGPNNTNVTRGIAAVLAIALVGGGGFFAGTQYAKASGTTSSVAGIGGMTGTNGGFGGRMGQTGGFGTVTAVSSSNITISEMQGGPNQSSSSSSTTSKTYTVTSSTTVTDDGNTASIGDINTGDTVMIQTSSSDSSTATTIRLNPTMGGGAMGQTQSSSTTDTSTSTSST